MRTTTARADSGSRPDSTCGGGGIQDSLKMILSSLLSSALRLACAGLTHLLPKKLSDDSPEQNPWRPPLCVSAAATTAVAASSCSGAHARLSGNLIRECLAGSRHASERHNAVYPLIRLHWKRGDGVVRLQRGLFSFGGGIDALNESRLRRPRQARINEAEEVVRDKSGRAGHACAEAERREALWQRRQKTLLACERQQVAALPTAHPCAGRSAWCRAGPAPRRCQRGSYSQSEESVELLR